MVERLYPYENPSSGHFRKRSIYAAGREYHGGGRGGSFNGRGLGRGRERRCGRGRGGHVQGAFVGGRGANETGIEISDVTRYFEYSEWAALSNDTRKRITEDLVRIKLLENKKRRITSSISAGKDNNNRLITKIITGVQNASRNESVLEEGVNRFPTNVSRAQVYAENRCSTSSNRNKTEEQSVVIYDHLGNLVTNT